MRNNGDNCFKCFVCGYDLCLMCVDKRLPPTSRVVSASVAAAPVRKLETIVDVD